MEKVTEITKEDLRKGVYAALECSVCGIEQTFAGDSEEEVLLVIKEEGWRNLDSDIYGSVGWWCGCDYDEDETENFAYTRD